MYYHYIIFSAQFTPHVGGVESYTESLLSELIRQGHAVSIVSIGPSDSEVVELRDQGATVFRLPGFFFMGGRFPVAAKSSLYRQFWDALKGLHPDRVIVNTRFYPHSLEGLQFAEDCKIPALVIDHGSNYLTLGNSFADAAIARYEDIITSRVKKFQPIFAGVSAKSVQWLQHFGIITNNVIPNAIDAPLFRSIASKRDFRQEYGIETRNLLIAFVGRLTPEKGPDKLLEALKVLNRVDIHVIFAGDGALRKELCSNAPSNAHFVGKVSQADISALLQQSDVFCLPTRSEGFCTALLEAAACGVPAIITDVGGARELIPSNDYGRIIHISSPESIACALDDLLSLGRDERILMGKRMQTLCEERYTWKASVRALESAFEG